MKRADAYNMPRVSLLPIAWTKDAEGWHAVEILGEPFRLAGKPEEFVVVCWLPEVAPGRITRRRLQSCAQRVWPKDEAGDPAPMLSIVPRAHLLYHDDMTQAVQRGARVVEDVLRRDTSLIEMASQRDAVSPALVFLQDASMTSKHAVSEFVQDLDELNVSIQESMERVTSLESLSAYFFFGGEGTREKYAESVPRQNPLHTLDVLFSTSALKRGQAPREVARHTELIEKVQNQCTLEERVQKLESEMMHIRAELKRGHSERKRKCLSADMSSSQATEEECVPQKRSKRVVFSESSEDSEATVTESSGQLQPSPAAYETFYRVTSHLPSLKNKRCDNLDIKINRNMDYMVKAWLQAVTESTDSTICIQKSSLEQLVVERLEQLEGRSDSITPRQWELLKNTKKPQITELQNKHKGRCWACHRTKFLSQKFHFGSTSVPMGRDCAHRIQCVLDWEAFASKLEERASPELQGFDSAYGHQQILKELQHLEGTFEQFMTGEGEE